MTSKKTLLAVGVVTALSLAIVACGPPAEPVEIQNSRQLIEEAWAEGPDLQRLELSLFANYPDLPIVTRLVAEAAQSPSPLLQTDAVRVYAASDSPEALAALQGLLAQGKGGTPLAAARALAMKGDASGQELLSENLRDPGDGTLRPETCAALAAVQENACVDEAFEDLGDKKDAAKRAAAAATLGEIGTQRSQQALRERLKDLHAAARVPVIEALGQVGDAETDVPLLLELAGFKETALAVIEALGHLGGDAAIEHLRTYLPLEDKPAARALAAVSLARLGQVDDDVRAALESGAFSDDVALRFRVAKGLRNADWGAIRELVAGLAQDPDASVRDAAMQATLGNADEYAFEAARQAYALGAEAQQGQEYEAAMKALRVVGGVPGKEAQDLLVGALDSFNLGYQLQAALAIVDRSVQGIAVTDDQP